MAAKVQFREGFVARVHEDLTWTLLEGGDEEARALDVVRGMFGPGWSSFEIEYYPTLAIGAATEAVFAHGGEIIEVVVPGGEYPEDAKL